jgi:putative Mg2+ transporter-C (MgtC) family protein
MESLAAEFGHPTFTPFPVIVARLLLAALAGAAIGFEREWRNRPAGLRTHIMVCVASAAFAILTIEIVHADVFAVGEVGDAVKVDPIRIVEAVTAGVAFLAAGVVIFTKGEVHGLTTGAGLWMAGAIGVAAGLGFWQIALLATFIGLTVLGLLHALERKLDLRGQDASKRNSAEREIAPQSGGLDRDRPGR